MIHIIVNPTAGNGKAKALLPELEKELLSRNIQYIVLETKKPMDAKRLARDACKENSTCIICLGGDGTIHEVTSGMVFSNVPLGIIPAGSGNDFAYSMGISPKESLKEHVERIIRRNIKTCDIIKSGEFYSVNVASVGLDAEIVGQAERFKKLFSKYSYLIATLISVFKFKNFDATLHIDNNVITGRFTLIAACNAKYYGGGFKIAPTADISDGFITLCVIKDFSVIMKALLFPTVIFGIHHKIKGVEFYNCKRVAISYDYARGINFDGNVYELKSPVAFELVPSGVKVIV